ncbi:MAG: heavy metal sensor histidine kinase [Acidobacteria bacterium]|nr:heavy metal sensor histidine kinase [Acidobacteriota bacterium]
MISACLLTYSVTIGISFTSHVRRDLDHRVHEDIELAARALVIDDDGNPAWAGGFLGKQIEEEEGGGHWVEVWDPSGQRLLVAGTFDPRIADHPSAHPSGITHSHETASGPIRTMWKTIELGGRRLIIRAAVSEAAARDRIRSLWVEVGLITLIVLVLGGIVGIELAKRLVGPLSRLAANARRITAEQLHERLEVRGGGEEIEQLGAAFNATLARLEESFAQLKRFTADASHEIRTPLTALRSVGEVALQGNKSGAEYREVIGTMLEESDRLARLAEGLLSIARAEAGQTHYEFEDLDLRTLADGVVEQLGVLAEERGQSVVVEGGRVVAAVDRVFLRQALVNLVDNAIKYSQEGASVRVRVARTGGGAEIAVSDDGPGIAPEHHARLFERFYRVDRSRSRELGGSGLGLALVKLAAEVHGGRVDVESNIGEGTTFRLTLPVRHARS